MRQTSLVQSDEIADDLVFYDIIGYSGRLTWCRLVKTVGYIAETGVSVKSFSKSDFMAEVRANDFTAQRLYAATSVMPCGHFCWSFCQ